MGYDRVGDGIDVSGVPEDVEMGNDSVGNSAKNQNNRCTTIKDMEDSND